MNSSAMLLKLILAFMAAIVLVVSTPINSADVHTIRGDGTLWTKADCHFSILYGKVMLSAMCQDQFSALDLNMQVSPWT